MNQPLLDQMIDALDQGVIVIDREGRIQLFNHWMVLHSGIAAKDAQAKPLLELFPQLDTPLYHRNLRSVLSFGNTAFFSHNASPWLIPLPPAPGSSKSYDRMQQSGQMGPLREGGEIRYAYLIIRDITETVTDVQKLTRLAMHDGLTGVWNRRWFDHWLKEEVERAGRYGRAMSLIIFDLDHFKGFNDQHGHQVGDQVLSSVASLCAGLIRTTDTLARYGGEEFCVLLPETEGEAGRGLAERLRLGVEALELRVEELRLAVTISLGVARFLPDMSAEGLVQAADAALYRAKQGGRNQVCVGWEGTDAGAMGPGHEKAPQD